MKLVHLNLVLFFLLYQLNFSLEELENNHQIIVKHLKLQEVLMLYQRIVD